MCDACIQAALGFVRTTGNTVHGYRFAHTPDFAPGLGRILKYGSARSGHPCLGVPR